ncbi:MAG: hypothetical protein V1772_13585, partial [Chloroflexota bacterium]
MRRTGLRHDLLISLIFLALPFIFFWSVTLGGKTLLPADNVFAWEPWASQADAAGVGAPHNTLLSDLYLENYAWKRLIVQSLRARQHPLWNPYILSGVPFLAAGQHSALYPLSLVFCILPLPTAYGWFAALHLFLAEILTYVLARTLGLSRPAGALAGLAFGFCGFMVIGNVFPMIVAAAVWLPLILAAIEATVQRAERGARELLGYIPLTALGAVAFGLSFLAGHPEMYYYVALTAGAYALWRLVTLTLRRPPLAPLALAAGAAAAMAAVGLGLAAAQWLPLLELARVNFRSAGATLREVLSWAYPLRHAVALLVPDFYGNPSHHAYLDLFTGQRTPVTVNALGQPIREVFWGIKSYVEGAAYVGVLPLVLALIALLR